MSGSDEVTPLPPHRVLERRLTHGRSAVVGLLFCAASLFSACFGIKTYENNLNKNLRVHTETDSGSWFSRVRAAVDIHRVGQDCATDYEGTVQLTEPVMDIGIPPDRVSHLVFVFASSSLFASRSGTITYETLLKPRPNYHYEVAVSYRNDMYDVAIQEIPPNRSAGRELDRLAFSACRSPSAQK